MTAPWALFLTECSIFSHIQQKPTDGNWVYIVCNKYITNYFCCLLEKAKIKYTCYPQGAEKWAGSASKVPLLSYSRQIKISFSLSALKKQVVYLIPACIVWEKIWHSPFS